LHSFSVLKGPDPFSALKQQKGPSFLKSPWYFHILFASSFTIALSKMTAITRQAIHNLLLLAFFLFISSGVSHWCRGMNVFPRISFIPVLFYYIEKIFGLFIWCYVHFVYICRKITEPLGLNNYPYFPYMMEFTIP
jgi:hypothetical protein